MLVPEISQLDHPSCMSPVQSDLCRRSQGSARILRAVSGILPGTSVSGWPRAVQPHIRAISHSSDVEVLMAVRRKQMLLAFPPDHPARRYPTLTRLGLVQRWAVLEIPAGDQLRTGAGASRWLLGDHLKRSVEVLPRRGCGYKPNVDELPASLCWVRVLEVLTPKELWRSENLSHPKFLGRH